MINPKHLQTFLAIHQAGSMSRASLKRRRSRSAVTYALDELEQALGVALFERDAHGMLLTEFGKVLYRRAELAMAEMRTARRTFNEMAAQKGVTCTNAPIFTLAVGSRRLAVLVAFAEHRHMGAVAELLGVSQPAVSQAVRELDLSTGLPLFEKSDGAMRLTAAGRLLLLHVKRALAQMRLASAEISLMKGRVEGLITVGALPFGSALILPRAITSLMAKYPRLRVHTVEGNFNALASGLWCGDIDLVVGAIQPLGHYATLVVERLFDESIAVFARRGHPLAESGEQDLRKALSMSWILPAQGTPTRQALADALGTENLPQPHVTIESSDLTTIRSVLMESDFLTAAAGRLFHHELQAGSLVSLPFSLPPVYRSIGLLRRTQDHLSPGAQLLIDEIRATGAAYANSPNTASAASSVAEMTASSWVAETKPASNAEGAK